MHEAPPLPAVLEHLRRLAPLDGGREQSSHPGIRGVPRHAGAVHVVVPERDSGASASPCPRRGEMFLRELAQCVDAAGVRRSVLGRERWEEDGAVVRIAGVEEARGEIGLPPRRGPHALP